MLGFWGAVYAVVRARRRLRLLHEAHAQALARRRIVEAGQEEERQRLARELHDGPLQTLYALRMQMARRGTDPRQHDAMVADISDHLRAVLETLRAPLLAPYGLADALQNLARAYPTCAFTFDLSAAAEQALPLQARNAVFRILQEALSNAVRHGQASHIEVSLRQQSGHVALTIADDGGGFDATIPPQSRARTGHYGLIGMRERVDVLGGTLVVTSSAAGTRLDIVLPREALAEVEMEEAPALLRKLPEEAGGT